MEFRMYDQQSHSPEISGLNHAAIEVNDLQAAIYFYREVMGLVQLPMPAAVKGIGIRWFDLKNGQALHLVENRKASSPNKAHFAIAVKDIEPWRTYLKRIGIEIIPPKVKLYNAERFFLRDPSGNRVELVKWLD